MSKRLLIAVLSVTVVALLVGMSTYAWYSDTASSTGNRFVAGTMNLQVDGAETMDAFTFHPVFPGWKADTKTYVLKNDGTVRGALTFTASNLVEAANGYPSGEQAVQNPDTADLAANLTVVVTCDGVEKYNGTLAALITDPATSLNCGILGGGDEATITLDFSVDGDSVGNEIMDDSATFDAAFGLVSVPL